VITDIARKEIRSYKQLPLNFYQIQTKFRDEIRPRFGVMRAREFVMKDAYSFHTSKASLEQTYEVMYQTYSSIFTRLGLKFRAVRADTGAIGGTGSHEFHVLADSGEDAIAFSPASDYAANVELAEALVPAIPRAAASQAMEKVATPGKKSIAEVSDFLKVTPAQTLKAIAVMHNDAFHLLLLRGDHELNEVKTQKILDPFRFATDAEIQQHMGCKPGYIGPLGVNVSIIADRAVTAMSDFVCGANDEGFHITGVNFGRDLPEPAQVADIRNVVVGDPSPDGQGTLDICRGIEVGHIFQLGDKYSRAMQATYLDENGQHQTMTMGCYGIGVSRIVAAAIEQGNDERGIIFPAAIAPFTVAIAAIGFDRSETVREAALKLHDELQAAGVDVLLDDRGERPGVMFADLELVGIPHRITVGERGLKEGQVEYQTRSGGEAKVIDLNEIVNFVKSSVCASSLQPCC
jgi:prolyl-tRNA synthetase